MTKINDKLAKLDIYPMFSSMNKFISAGKTYEEWLHSLPLELLEEYSEHSDNREESTKKEEIIDQDYLATVMMLHAMETDNEPIEAEDIIKKIKSFQIILCGLHINKSATEQTGMNITIIEMNLGTWDSFLAGHMRANLEIEFIDESDKKKPVKKKMK